MFGTAQSPRPKRAYLNFSDKVPGSRTGMQVEVIVPTGPPVRMSLPTTLAKARNNKRNRPAWMRLLSRSKRRAERELVNSGLFDAEWYMREYPDVADSAHSPAGHYLEEGYLHGYRPNPLFDTRWYLERYEDVRSAGVNPLLHYLQSGYKEGRDPGPEFETDFYLMTYPDVRLSGMNPLGHYLLHGRHEGRLPIKPRGGG
jgi:hypothetical protein